MNDSYKWVRASVDQVLSPTPVYLATVIITPHKEKVGQVTMYNGETTNDPQVLFMQTESSGSLVINFNPPLFLNKGLYVDIIQDVDDVLFHFSSEKE